TWTDFGLRLFTRPRLMPVEQAPRIRFDRSLANGAIGFGGLHVLLTPPPAAPQFAIQQARLAARPWGRERCRAGLCRLQLGEQQPQSPHSWPDSAGLGVARLVHASREVPTILI